LIASLALYQASTSPALYDDGKAKRPSSWRPTLAGPTGAASGKIHRTAYQTMIAVLALKWSR
jgi:hypothetical protein